MRSVLCQPVSDQGRLENLQELFNKINNGLSRRDEAKIIRKMAQIIGLGARRLPKWKVIRASSRAIIASQNFFQITTKKIRIHSDVSVNGRSGIVLGIADDGRVKVKVYDSRRISLFKPSKIKVEG